MKNDTYGPRTSAWEDLEASAKRLRTQSIDALFVADSARGDTFAAEAAGLFLDFSRQKIDAAAFEQLCSLAEQTSVAEWVKRMFLAEPINNTEDRPALHIALRRPRESSLPVDGCDVMPDVEAQREKIQSLATALEAGALYGDTGKPITTVVNIGIGGSDLGIAMAVEALAEYRLPAVDVHFVSNIDGVDLVHVLRVVDPETTLFVICSKSFTTLETLANAQAVRAWLMKHGGESAVAAQCIAVSTNHAAMDAFGIADDKRLAMWDWVGGRFSLWSAVGLSIALAIGWKNFSALLEGAHEMDQHFQNTPARSNLPVLLALVGIWNRNFMASDSLAVLPYDDHLARFPAFLQQLEMESNGKSVRRNGEPVECATCPVVWGEPGSNAQHSFYQLLHQGTLNVAVDFLLPRRSGVGMDDQHELAIANCLAQTWALASGDPAGQASSSHQQYPGSRGSTLLLFDRLDPATLGKLVALYEHKVFVQGVIWDVNSFDQFGVELGKRLASELLRISASTQPAPIAAAVRWLKNKH